MDSTNDKSYSKNNELSIVHSIDDKKNLSRSNSIMRARDASNMNLTQSNIILIAMAHAKMTPSGYAQADLYPSICGLYKGISKKNLSRVFEELAVLCDTGELNTPYIIKNEIEGTREILYTIQSVKYHEDTGLLQIKFTEPFTQKFGMLKDASQFTTLNIEKLTQFKHCGSRKLFDILSSYEFRLNTYDHYAISFDLAELKYDLGLLNEKYKGNESILAKKLKRVPTPRELFEFCPEIEQYSGKDGWSNFKKRILDTTKKEIDKRIAKGEELFTFEYDVQRSGRGGKVSIVNFTIFYPNKKAKKSRSTTYKEINGKKVDLQLYHSYRNIFKKGEEKHITDKSIEVLMRFSNNDVELTTRAYNYCATRDVRDIVAAMVDYLKNPDEYSPDIPNNPRYATYEETMEADRRCKKYLEVGDKIEREVKREVEELSLDKKVKIVERDSDDIFMIPVSQMKELVDSYNKDGNLKDNIDYICENYLVIGDDDLPATIYIINSTCEALFNFRLDFKNAHIIIQSLNYDVTDFIKLLYDVYNTDGAIDNRDLASQLKIRLKQKKNSRD